MRSPNLPSAFLKQRMQEAIRSSPASPCDFSRANRLSAWHSPLFRCGEVPCDDTISALSVGLKEGGEIERRRLVDAVARRMPGLPCVVVPRIPQQIEELTGSAKANPLL